MALFNVLFDIAAKTASFESSMTRIEKRIDGVASFAKKAGAILGVTFAANQFRGFIVGAIEAGDAMAKAAQKAGANVEQFSELAYAAQLADVSLASLSNSVKFMQKEIATGGDSIKAIGVNLIELRNLEPDKQFEVLADAIAGIQDPAERTRRVLEIFGKAGADLLPLFEQGADGIRKARVEARELGKVLTEENAKAIQEADDAIKRLKASYEAFAQTFAVKVVPAVTAMADSFRKLLGGATDLEKLRSKLEYFERFRDDPLNIPLMLNLGFDDGSGAIMTGKEIDRRIAEIRAQIERLSSSAADGEALIPITISVKRLESPREAERSVNPQTLLEMRRNFEFIEELQDQAAAGARESAAASADTLASLNEMAGARISGLIAETTRQNEESLEAMADTGKSAFAQLSTFADQAARNMQSFLADFLFDPFEDGLKGMLKGFVDVVRRMVAEAAAAKIFDSLGGGSGLLGSILSGLFGGAKASGGSVSSGKGYIVGERGPEWFSPSTAGSIIPNNQLATASGSPINITTNIDARGATQELIGALPEILKRSNESLEAKIVDGLRRKKYGL